MTPQLTEEQKNLLDAYARQCLARHIQMSRWSLNPLTNSLFAERNPDVFISNCARSAYTAILNGNDSWERIEKSVAETSATL